MKKAPSRKAGGFFVLVEEISRYLDQSDEQLGESLEDGDGEQSEDEPEPSPVEEGSEKSCHELNSIPRRLQSILWKVFCLHSGHTGYILVVIVGVVLTDKGYQIPALGTVVVNAIASADSPWIADSVMVQW